MAKINVKGLDAEIAMKGYKIFKPAVEERVQRIFNRANTELMQDFEVNPITAALEGGANGGTGGVIGFGSLFSFLGFAAGSDPVAPVRSYLRGSVYLVSMRKKRNELALRMNFSLPTKGGAIAAAPTLPWSSESWVAAIENGVSNLGHYLYHPHSTDKSRSEEAIQVKTKINSATSSSPTPYISQIIDRVARSVEAGLKRL